MWATKFHTHTKQQDKLYFCMYTNQVVPSKKVSEAMSGLWASDTHLGGVGLTIHRVFGSLIASGTPVAMELLQPVRIFERTANQFWNMTRCNTD